MRLSNFRENDRVLLLGEGNFSFAVSLVKHNLPITITASCYEPLLKNDNTKNNVDLLRAHGIRVLLGVDATKISEHSSLQTRSFDKIVFNFPHVGGKMRLDKNRELLREFFISAREYLRLDGTILMTLCNGQGGTLADEPKRHWNDSWKVKEMAAHGNFILTHVEPFIVDNFADYNSTGYRGLEKEFNVKNSLTHFFARLESPSVEHLAPVTKVDFSELEKTRRKIGYVDILPDSDKCLNSLNPPIFVFDLTFSVAEDFREIRLYAILHNSVGKIVRNVEFVGSYRFPDGKITRTYRINYQSDIVPLYRRRIVHIHQHVVAKILEDNLNVIVTR